MTISFHDYYSEDEGKTTTVEAYNMYRQNRKETLNVPLEEFTRGAIDYNNGKLIQEAFPFLSASEREFLMTGMTKQEQKEIFGENYDD